MLADAAEKIILKDGVIRYTSSNKMPVRARLFDFLPKMIKAINNF